MKKSNLSKSMSLISFIFLCGLGHASDLIVTKSFTGGWYDPAKNGQGFLLEIIKSNNQKKALTTWFTFDAAGNQYWLIGVGDIVGQSIDFQMLVPEGGKFGNLHNPNNMTNTVWGNVRFTFSDCNTGTVTWDPVLSGFHSGSMPITRSTIINNLNCTGGLYDELGDTIEDSELTTALRSTGVINDARGKTKYEQRSDRIDFSVEIEHVPVGTYELMIGGQYQGDIQVVTLSNGFNEGEIEFRDPVEPGKLPLDFDPRGQVVDIIKDQVIVLTSDDSVGNGGGGNTSGQAPPFGNSETELYMVNSGIQPLGQAKVKLRQRPDRVDFQVELEDVPVGFYDLNVSGQMQGVIEVMQTAAGVEGELEFRNPVEAGKELLDFNPLGELITMTQGLDTLFTLNFPATPGNDDNDCDSDPAGDDCDDNNGNNR